MSLVWAFATATSPYTQATDELKVDYRAASNYRFADIWQALQYFTYKILTLTTLRKHCLTCLKFSFSFIKKITITLEA